MGEEHVAEAGWQSSCLLGMREICFFTIKRFKKSCELFKKSSSWGWSCGRLSGRRAVPFDFGDSRPEQGTRW